MCRVRAYYARIVNARRGRTRSGSAAYPHSTAYPPWIRGGIRSFKYGYARVRSSLSSADPPESSRVRFERTAYTVSRNNYHDMRRVRQSSELRACVEKFSNFLYSTGGSHKHLGPGVIYLLLFILTGLGALIYALINALKKLMP